jgi:hypothetical protein
MDQLKQLSSLFGPQAAGAASTAAGIGGTLAGGAALMNPLTAGLAALPAGIELISGLSQIKKAKALERANQRPTMQVPNEVSTATGLARGQWLDPTMAGQQRAEERLGTSVANTLQAAQDVGTGGAGQLSALVASDRNRQLGFGNLATQAAQMQYGDTLNYQNALQAQAPWAQKAWEYNVQQPYEQAAAAASALRESGNRNIYTGVSNLASTAIGTDFGSLFKKGADGKTTGGAPASAMGGANAGGFNFGGTGSDAFKGGILQPTVGSKEAMPMPTTSSPSIQLNPDGSFPMDQINKNTMTKSVTQYSPVAPTTEGRGMFNASGIPSASPIAAPTETQTYDVYSTSQAAPYNSALPATPKAPAGSLYGDELYKKLGWNPSYLIK